MSESTKILLEETLVKELSEKTLDKITVKSLCEKIKITRQAFYYHFSDVYSLLEYIYTNEAEKTIGKNRTYDSWILGYKNIFDKMLTYKRFVINTYRSISREYLENYLYNVTFNLLYCVIEEKAKDYPCVSTKQRKFIANFYKYAFVGIVLDWVSKDMQKDPDEIIFYFSNIIKGDFVEALKTFNEAKTK